MPEFEPLTSSALRCHIWLYHYTLLKTLSGNFNVGNPLRLGKDAWV